MPVAAQQQHFRRSVVPPGILGNAIERFLQQQEPFVSRKAHMHGRPVPLARRTDRLADLHRVAQHEVCGDRGDAVRTPERGFEVDTFVVAEPIPEFPHDGDVRPAEPIDRLPVIPDRKQLRARRTVEERLQQPRPRRRNVLELVDQDVAERAAIAAGLHMIGGPVDHVVEVDFSCAGQTCPGSARAPARTPRRTPSPALRRQGHGPVRRFRPGTAGCP